MTTVECWTIYITSSLMIALIFLIIGVSFMESRYYEDYFSKAVRKPFLVLLAIVWGLLIHSFVILAVTYYLLRLSYYPLYCIFIKKKYRKSFEDYMN